MCLLAFLFYDFFNPSGRINCAKVREWGKIWALIFKKISKAATGAAFMQKPPPSGEGSEYNMAKN